MLFQEPAEVAIVLNQFVQPQKLDSIVNRGQKSLPICYSDHHEITGQVKIELKGGKNLNHQGIYIELVCQIQDKFSDITYTIQEEVIQLEEKNCLNDSKSYDFSFQNFPMSLEAYKGVFASIRYYLKAVVKRRIRADLIAEQEFMVRCPKPKNQRSRMLYKEVTDDEDEIRLVYQQDKKEYFLGDCIVGKFDIEGDSQKPKALAVSLNKWECYRLTSEIGGIKEHLELIQYVDLSKYLTNDDTDNIVPFKIPFNRYDLQPTMKFLDGSACFYVGYFVTIIFTEMNGKQWEKSFSFILQREQE